MIHFIICIIKEVDNELSFEWQSFEKTLSEYVENSEESTLDQLNDLLNFFRYKRKFLQDIEFKEYLERRVIEIEKYYKEVKNKILEINTKL